MRRFTAAFLTLALSTLFLTSCRDAIEVDELVYVASIGIDRGVSDYWRLSVKYPVMRSSGEDGQTSGAKKGEDGEYGVVTMDAPSFYTGVDMIDSNVSRHLNFQHIKFIVISEEVARSGMMKNYLAPIVRFREIRRTAFVLVCKGSAKEFLEKNKPTLGSSLTKNMDDWIIQMEHTGFYTDTTLKDFYNKMKSPYQQPTAILAAINEGENFVEEGPKPDASVNVKSEYEAGQLPVKGGNDAELFGCALFDGDKMVDALGGYETRLLLMITDEFVNGNFTVPDPKNKDSLISVKLETERKPVMKVDLREDAPKLYIKLRLNGEILGMQGELNYEGEKLKPLLERSISSQLKNDCDKLLNKCKRNREDIFGFGGVAARQFATVGAWEKYDWFRHFEKSRINTEVQVTIKRSGTFVKTYPIVTNEGEK